MNLSQGKRFLRQRPARADMSMDHWGGHDAGWPLFYNDIALLTLIEEALSMLSHKALDK